MTSSPTTVAAAAADPPLPRPTKTRCESCRCEFRCKIDDSRTDFGDDDEDELFFHPGRMRNVRRYVLVVLSQVLAVGVWTLSGGASMNASIFLVTLVRLVVRFVWALRRELLRVDAWCCATLHLLGDAESAAAVAPRYTTPRDRMLSKPLTSWETALLVCGMYFNAFFFYALVFALFKSLESPASSASAYVAIFWVLTYIRVEPPNSIEELKAERRREEEEEECRVARLKRASETVGAPSVATVTS